MIPYNIIKKDVLGEVKTLYSLLQCTWGLPQTFVGIIYFLANGGCKHYRFHGSVVTEWGSKSSLSLGMFVFVSDDPFYYYQEYTQQYSEQEFSRMLLVHEYGHTIQSLIFGPAYLFLVGIPSIAWSFLPAFVKKRKREHISYFSAYPERWANQLGEKVTGDNSIGEPIAHSSRGY